jgi:hypothetical protein
MIWIEKPKHLGNANLVPSRFYFIIRAFWNRSQWSLIILTLLDAGSCALPPGRLRRPGLLHALIQYFTTLNRIQNVKVVTDRKQNPFRRVSALDPPIHFFIHISAFIFFHIFKFSLFSFLNLTRRISFTKPIT